VVVADYIVFAKPVFWIEPLSAMVYFANYLNAHYIVAHTHMRMPFNIFWSLSIEEHYYLLFPMVFSIMARDTRKLVVLLIAICSMCLALRLITAYLHPEYLGSFYFNLRSEFRLDSIAYGVFLAVACETETGRRIVQALGHPAMVFAALLLLVASFVIRNQWFRDTLLFSMQSVGVAVLMAAVLFSNRYRYAQMFLNLSFIKWVGVLSYSLYIWHFVVSIILRQIMPEASSFEMASTGLFLSFAIAALSYYAIEKPLMGLRRHFGSRTV
jgi:peptidoglycan/LPS O-acetylase OafA/YrhL